PIDLNETLNIALLI
uniref:Uncharacterized protein n=1 Tax=Amphimedon queenslandica TaxID=400682 RepID=A0A1X7SFF1_AMPQE